MRHRVDVGGVEPPGVLGDPVQDRPLLTGEQPLANRSRRRRWQQSRDATEMIAIAAPRRLPRFPLLILVVLTQRERRVQCRPGQAGPDRAVTHPQVERARLDDEPPLLVIEAEVLRAERERDCLALARR